jgi:hypothetical protein
MEHHALSPWRRHGDTGRKFSRAGALTIENSGFDAGPSAGNREKAVKIFGKRI